MNHGQYTTRLQAGLGMIDETRTLLDLWEEGMTVPSLQKAALESGQFPTMAARRLRNLVAECFGPRYLNENGQTVGLLKRLGKTVSSREMEQLFFIHTCRANAILADFVSEVYWPAYSGGRQTVSNDDAQAFVMKANEAGKTTKPWSPSTIRRVASYLTGSCADFGLLERGSKSTRKINPWRIESRVAGYLAYDLHFKGLGDNRIVSSDEWALFGMDRRDVLEELRKLTLRGWVILQTAGDVTRIGWVHRSMEELANAIAQE